MKTSLCFNEVWCRNLILHLPLLFPFNKSLPNLKKTQQNSPGWCGSADGVLACKPKGHWFNPQSGHMPGLRARSPVEGAQEATDWCVYCTSTFLPISFPFSLKINKYFKKIISDYFPMYSRASALLGDEYSLQHVSCHTLHWSTLL